MQHMRNTYDSTLGYIHDAHLITEYLQHYFTPAEISGKDVLDLGCRLGDFSEGFVKLGAANVYGIDINKRAIGSARKRLSSYAQVHFAAGDIRDLSHIPSASQDIIFCKGALIYIDGRHMRSFLNSCKRILRPGGIIFFTLLKDAPPWKHAVTALINRMPLRLLSALATVGSYLMIPFSPFFFGRFVADARYIRNDALIGIKGVHYGIPAAVPSDAMVPTETSCFGSEATTGTFMIRLKR